MKLVFFSAKPYDKEFFEAGNKHYDFELEFWETHLGLHVADAVKSGTDAVCVFVNDKVTADVIEILAGKGVKILALRCAGFNNLDIAAAEKYGMRVCRVPAYSPQAVAEHAVAMLLTLNRKTHKAYNRVREQNFSLTGLIGFNLFGKTVGVIGTGKIGAAFCKIMMGFGCLVNASDPLEDEALKSSGVNYLPFHEVIANADIISLHCPLTPENHHLINSASIASMKKGVVLINTSRGGLISALGIDVYEQEEKLFFRDLSSAIIGDDDIQRLISFPNVLITGHQAFFTAEALSEIASCTLETVSALLKNETIKNTSAILL
ncbi:MAG: 2-hydroxyacid dehydrogenase [Sphingobacteriales bacterium]|nr:MAG: 2-hydroxyacid dehydrogenase [Sphingobacteriales bacterium]